MSHTLPVEALSALVGAADAFEYVPGSLTSGVVVLCDHATNAFPSGYGTLGLPAAQIERHIAYDPGAAEVARLVAAALGAPALLTRYSRLLIDLNRGEDDPTLIMRISDGAIIPGNASITPAETRKRIEQYYRPYHDAADRLIGAMIAGGKPPVVFSVHSFTENWRGWMRPWHAGVLWDRDPRLAIPLLNALRDVFVIGDNEPYSGGLGGDSIHRHATQRGLANALIELRQDLIRDAAGQCAWAERLAGILRRLLVNPSAAATFHTIRYYGSRSDGAMCGANGRENIDMIAPNLDDPSLTELEAAAFRRLVLHLRERTDVQNIDMMNLAGFCRNCLGNWLADAAKEKGAPLTKEEARTLVYGMAYDEWKAAHQREASTEQLAQFEVSRPRENQ